MKNRRREGVMTMFRCGRALALLALVVAVGVAGASLAIAGGSGEFDQADSAADLKEARGVVYDHTSDGIWVITGEWTLDCDDACAEADLDDIQFDLAHVMVELDGERSHSHSYTDFLATTVNVDVVNDNLTIFGEITGSGPIGPNPITIELIDVDFSENFSIFSFTLDDNDHLQGTIGGVIVESED